jgi:hypothetical protein
MGVDEAESRLADNDTGDQFSQNRRLADSLDKCPADLGHPEHDNQHPEQVRNLEVLHQPVHPPLRNRQSVQSPGTFQRESNILSHLQASLHPISRLSQAVVPLEV